MKLSEAEQHIHNLLAVIFRDGGHRAASYPTLQEAVDAAHEEWARLVQAAERDRVFVATAGSAWEAPYMDCPVVFDSQAAAIEFLAEKYGLRIPDGERYHSNDERWVEVCERQITPGRWPTSASRGNTIKTSQTAGTRGSGGCER